MLASVLALGCWLTGSALFGQGPSLGPPMAPPPAPLPLTVHSAMPTPAPQVHSHSAPTATLQPVAAQMPTTGPGSAADAQEGGYEIQLEPPGPEVLFRLDSEAASLERMRQKARATPGVGRLIFPDEPVLSNTPYYGRAWPQMKMIVPSHYVCHKRLYFEEVNSERYGWELGIFQPIVSTGFFLKDFFLFPYHAGTEMCRRFDSSAGKCLPGDPVPYLLYPPELSATGTLAEGAVIATLLAVFP